MVERRTGVRLAGLSLALATAGLVPLSLTATADEAGAVPHDGPHAPKNRVPAATTVTRSSGAVVRDVDLGDAALGPKGNPDAFRAPVRGVLVTPDKPKAHAPLVVFSHLRTFGCADNTFAYPCAKGVQEIRADRGMTYLGQALAAKGYAVLIPDLSPVWLGEGLKKPYDQDAGWVNVVGRLRDEVMAANSGKASKFGDGLAGAVDGSHTALVTHSRSAMIADLAVKTWATSTTPIASVAAYGGFYALPEGDKDPFGPPPPPGIPFLSIDGTEDNDVKLAAPTWLPQHVGQRRTAAALSVLLPGFGHNYINRALSGRHVDDRPAPGPSAPSAAAHEKMLAGTIATWLDQTVRGAKGPLPVHAADALPATIAGVPARWVAVTPEPAARWTADAAADTITAVGKGGTLKRCRTYMPMDPTPYPDRCPDTDSGTSQARSRIVRITLTPTGGAQVALKQAHPQHIALHLAPAGDRADDKAQTSLTLTATLATGKKVTVPVPDGQAALRNLRTKEVNGLYTLATLRVPLPAEVRSGTITHITLTGGTGTGTIDLRGIDLIPASHHSGR